MQCCPLSPGSGEQRGCWEFWPLPSPLPGRRSGVGSWEELGTLVWGQTDKIINSTFTVAAAAASAAAA